MNDSSAFEQTQPALERLPEPGLLKPEGFGDQRFRPDQLRIGLPHLPHQRWHEPPHQRFARAQQLRVAHPAPHDAAKNVAPPFVGRKNPVRHQKTGSPEVIGNHAMTNTHRPFGIDGDKIRDGTDQRSHQVGLVIVMRALKHCRDALKPHARVDRRLRQPNPFATRQLLELHENEVPDLDEAIAVGIGRTRRAARNMRAMVVENLGTGTAGAGIAHGPEIVGGRDADDAIIRQPGDLLPQPERFIVFVIDGDRELILGKSKFPGNQIPGKGNRIVLEIVTKREIAEHLEKGVMPRGIADVVEIVVFAAGPDALLRGRRARKGRRLDTGEQVLELNHPGIGEHQGRIIARHKRRRRHDRVAVLREKIQKRGPDLINAAHVKTLLQPQPGQMFSRQRF